MVVPRTTIKCSLVVRGTTIYFSLIRTLTISILSLFRLCEHRSQTWSSRMNYVSALVQNECTVVKRIYKSLQKLKTPGQYNFSLQSYDKLFTWYNATTGCVGEMNVLPSPLDSFCLIISHYVRPLVWVSGIATDNIKCEVKG